MKNYFATLSIALFATVAPSLVSASQADDTTITLTAKTAGVTPFISQLSLSANDTTTLKSIRFTVTPKPGSVTRPLAATYSRSYLVQRGDLQPATGDIFLTVYGLYAGYNNIVNLRYFFNDGSSKTARIFVQTADFTHPCGLDAPTVLQARTRDTSLSYDYMLVKGGCSSYEPAIMDTDGALRWASPAGFSVLPSAFYNNAIYQSKGSALYRVDLDGTVTMLHDYSDIGATFLHHNIDPGKFGLVLDLDTTDQIESVNVEVDAAGNILKRWNLADIISAAMVAGGDDPSEFVYSAPDDWFHNNAVTYNRADDSMLISSRESFVICLDYETKAIKWILGDPTKNWHRFPSLARYALTLPNGSLPPIGQHALSISYDQGLLLFDNGYNSIFQTPKGTQRTYASPRKYQIDLEAMTATEVWNYEMGQSILSPICGSVYEDAPLNYVIDYAFVGGFTADQPHAQILGLNKAGKKVFYYQYETNFCDTAYNTTPLHLETSKFPVVAKKALNISTRGYVGARQEALIGGFIVSGSAPKTVVLRALGPSLDDTGLSNTVANPVITLYDSDGGVVAQNDDWQNGPRAEQIMADGLAPGNPVEAALRVTLDPAAYTAVVTNKKNMPGVGLVEVYDLSPASDSELANISTRGSVGNDEDVLITGFIVGEVDSSTVAVRVLGPSLGKAGIDNPLSDPKLTVYDSNGAALATNDNWQDDPTAMDLEGNGLAPRNPSESAAILHLPAGAYTTIASGADGETGVGLVEVYNLN